MYFFKRFPTLLTLGVVLSALYLAGCSHNSGKSSEARAAGTHGAEAVQADPNFTAAAQCFTRHDYRHALGFLDVIGRRPGLTGDAAAQSFLAYQRLLCRHALDPRVAMVRPLPPTERIVHA